MEKFDLCKGGVSLARMGETESDLVFDVFFANVLRGKTPYVGVNSNWWIDGTDTGVLARGTDGNTPMPGGNGNWWIAGMDTGVRASAVTVNIGANNNWWIDGTDTGIRAKAPVVSVGVNGNWFIDGVDTGLPSLSLSALDKNTADVQTVSGKVVFNDLAVRRRDCYLSNPDLPAAANGFAQETVGADDPRYLIACPRNTSGKVEFRITTPPNYGEMYVIASLSKDREVGISCSGSFIWAEGHGDGDRPAYITFSGRKTVFMHGAGDRWYLLGT